MFLLDPSRTRAQELRALHERRHHPHRNRYEFKEGAEAQALR